MKTKQYVCTLTIGYEESEEGAQFADRLLDLQKRNLIYSIVEARGPSGGWPEVKITGSLEDIIKYIKSYDVEYDNNIASDLDYYDICEVRHNEGTLSKIFRTDVSLGALEAIEAGIDSFLAAIGIKFPEVYYKVIELRSLPGGTEVSISAISENKKQLHAFEKALDIDSEQYDYKTFSEDGINKLLKRK